jgi:hypothetical protein
MPPLSAIAPLLPLGHGGAGAAWQAVVTGVALGVAVTFVLVVVGRIELRSAGDLITPLAIALVVGSLATSAQTVLSDWVGYAMIAGGLALLALVSAASIDRFDLRANWSAAVTFAALAAIPTMLWGGTLNAEVHPPQEPQKARLPNAGDAVLTMVEPGPDATIAAGEVELVFAVEGGSIGPRIGSQPIPPPDDPQGLGHVRLFVDNRPVTTSDEDRCSVAEPCDEVTYTLVLEPGSHRVTAEFIAYDGAQFAPIVAVVTTITAE